jgi:hypothetical protein
VSAGFDIAGEVFWGTNGAVEAYLEALASEAAARQGVNGPLAAFFRAERNGFFPGKVVVLDGCLTTPADRERFAALLDAATERLTGERRFTDAGGRWVSTVIAALRARAISGVSVESCEDGVRRDRQQLAPKQALVRTDFPEQLRRHPTREGREALASRLGMTIDPHSQDWEWEIADVRHFDRWLALYEAADLSEDERFSLMEMLIQGVDDLSSSDPDHEIEVEQLPEWLAVAALLRRRPQLHASSIAYWSVFEAEQPDELFRVSGAMRRLWTEVQERLAEQPVATDDAGAPRRPRS